VKALHLKIKKKLKIENQLKRENKEVNRVNKRPKKNLL